jgi:hypothetical protein
LLFVVFRPHDSKKRRGTPTNPLNETLEIALVVVKNQHLESPTAGE